MARHNTVGKEGEQLALQYFTAKGYNPLHVNWRHRFWEVDLVAEKEGILHFIEVKTRTGYKRGFPEENVDRKKIRYLIDASAEYLYLYPQWTKIQFDVLAITILPGQVDYFLIEDVYE